MTDHFIVQGKMVTLEKQIFRKISGIFEGKQAVFFGSQSPRTNLMNLNIRNMNVLAHHVKVLRFLKHYPPYL